MMSPTSPGEDSSCPGLQAFHQRGAAGSAMCLEALCRVKVNRFAQGHHDHGGRTGFDLVLPALEPSHTPCAQKSMSAWHTVSPQGSCSFKGIAPSLGRVSNLFWDITQFHCAKIKAE